MENITLIPWWRTLTGESELNKMAESFTNERISYGKVCKDLESRLSKLLNVPYVMMCSSGSTALYIGVKSMGIGPGDEVLVQDRTFHATAHAAMLAGASVRLVEVEKDSPIMDLNDLRKKISPKTKAIMPVHLNGRANHMKEIKQIAKEHNLFVIEDVAQAFYSKTEDGFLGTLGDVGCFSFGMTKLVSTGQGGFVCTHNENVYKNFKHFISHGVEDTFDGVFNNFGFNFRMTDILASIGHVQLDRLEQKLAHVEKVHKMYEDGIKDLSFLSLIPVKIESEVPLWVEVMVADRAPLREFLYENGIESRKFLPSLHTSSHINVLNDQNFTNSKRFEDQGLFLPAGPDMSLENVQKVLEALHRYK